MEPDKSGGLAAAERSDPVTRVGGVTVVLGLALTLGALGYFYLNRDGARETASAPATEQAPPPASKGVAAATPPAAEPVRPPAAPQQVASPAPSTATPSASSASSTLSPPPGAERPATPAQVQVPAQAPAAASSAPVESAAQAPRQPDPLTNQPASLPADDVVFVQKPGVNIRAEPSRRGRVVGSASRGQQFKVVGRSGSWIQVEGDGRKGWIGGRMLGPRSP